MMQMRRLKVPLIILLACAGCQSGGSGDSVDSPDPITGAEKWLAQANVSSDTCGERIAPVRQTFLIDSNGATATVDTSIIKLSGPVDGDNLTVGFEETNGECVRSYTAAFTGLSSPTAAVHFTSHSNCGGSVCQSEWIGTASKVNS